MFARTERLLLRPAWVEDIPALAEAMDREDVTSNLAHVPWPYSVADAESFLTRDRKLGETNLLIFERTSAEPRLIGGIGLTRDGGQSTLGYWIVPSSWGKGFATEAGRAVIDLARETLRIGQLTAQSLVDNPASGRVLRKLGFHPTGERAPLFNGGGNISARRQSYTLKLNTLALAA
jgi:RimJ/RimL family protein N-acetyltransferase